MLPPQQRRIKSKIKPPKKHGADANAQETWERLKKAILEIQNENASKLSFEENYRYAYNLVLWKHGRTLYEGVLRLIAEHLARLTNEIIAPTFPSGNLTDPITRGQQGEMLVKAVRTVWDKHNSSMRKLADILKYMDRVHTASENVPEITIAGLHLFLDNVLHSKSLPVREHVINALLGQVQVERDGYSINRSAMKECVEVYTTLINPRNGIKVYYEDLEPSFMDESQRFYAAEAQKLLETCDAPEYLLRTEERLTSEEDRAHHYLAATTAQPLRKTVEKYLLAPNLQTVVSMPGSGLDRMIDADRIDDLRRLYRLFVHVSSASDGLQTLKKALRESVINRGRLINDSECGAQASSDEKGKGKARVGAQAQTLEDALRWVKDSLDLKVKFDRVLKHAFDSDKVLETAIIEALETFVNSNPRAPEYISLFIDENLKKGLKGKTDDEIELVLDRTITLFRFITEKDAFERYYKGHLARRLLSGRSVSDDAERGMLAKLKVECGFQFTKKMEGMFQDMKISADTTSEYKNYIQSTGASIAELNVTVMTSTFWPMSQASPTCVVPQELLQAYNSFEHYYNSRHSGRRLTWQPSLGNADLIARFKTREHTLNVSTYAAIILLLFQDLPLDDFLMYEDIKNATSIPEADLQRNLQSLACAKFKVIKKHPPSRDVSTTDSFSFNVDFTANLARIKISTIANKVESQEERKETTERIEEERKHQTDACIVRVMKDRKTLGHNDLINEVTKLLANRFSPQPQMIKRRIEQLIEKEYLERMPDRKTYRYLA